MSFIYLGSPYSHDDHEMMHRRYRAAMARTANMLHQGIKVYSPIVHNHEMAREFNLPRGIDFWMEYDFAILSKASEFHILMLPGWDESEGLRKESNHASLCGVREELLLPTDEELAWLEY